jgi:hypothetical protein
MLSSGIDNPSFSNSGSRDCRPNVCKFRCIIFLYHQLFCLGWLKIADVHTGQSHRTSCKFGDELAIQAAYHTQSIVVQYSLYQARMHRMNCAELRHNINFN